MRILHTSDWHLGRSLGQHRLLGDQATVCDWMVDVVRAEGVELVVVAGDLFDRSVPPSDAWELLWHTFRRFTELGAVVAAIAGNHDSAERLGATDGVTDRSGVLLRGGYGPAAQVDRVQLASGPLALVTAPYLDPRMAPAAVREELGSVAVTHETVLRHALDASRRSLPEGLPSLVVSHAFVTGARASDSERDLAVGEAAMVSADTFERFDYVALGHLHRPQLVDGRAHVRYPGAPLAYSFGETGTKEVLLVDLAADGAVQVRPLPVEVGRGVRTVRGRLHDLLSGSIDDRSWVRAELTDADRPVDAARRLRGVFPGIAEVEWVGVRPADALLRARAARHRAPHELAGEFWSEVTGTLPDEEVAQLLFELVDPGPSGPGRGSAGELPGGRGAAA